MILATGTAVYPAISGGGDTLYCIAVGGISRSINVSGTWSEPQALGISASLPRHPAVTPDGKRLYFIDYGSGFGGWDLWVSERSDSLQAWTEKINAGPVINTAENEWSAFAPNRNKLIFIRNGYTSKILATEWSESASTWLSPTLAENENVSRGGDVEGVTMTGDGNKMYVGMGTAVNGISEFELEVSYRDVATGQFGTPLRLNINSHPPDTVLSYNPQNRGFDGFPSITPDGRWLFFVSDRAPDSANTNYHDIYLSRLLVDENGDTVLTSVFDDMFVPLSIMTPHNYPNPFNPNTTIVFEVPIRDRITISLYDLSGRLLGVVADSVFEQGTHHFKILYPFSSSGAYFYRIEGRRIPAQVGRFLYIH